MRSTMKTALYIHKLLTAECVTLLWSEKTIGQNTRDDDDFKKLKKIKKIRDQIKTNTIYKFWDKYNESRFLNDDNEGKDW